MALPLLPPVVNLDEYNKPDRWHGPRNDPEWDARFPTSHDNDDKLPDHFLNLVVDPQAQDGNDWAFSQTGMTEVSNFAGNPFGSSDVLDYEIAFTYGISKAAGTGTILGETGHSTAINQGRAYSAGIDLAFDTVPAGSTLTVIPKLLFWSTAYSVLASTRIGPTVTVTAALTRYRASVENQIPDVSAVAASLRLDISLTTTGSSSITTTWTNATLGASQTDPGPWYHAANRAIRWMGTENNSTSRGPIAPHGPPPKLAVYSVRTSGWNA